MAVGEKRPEEDSYVGVPPSPQPFQGEPFRENSASNPTDSFSLASYLHPTNSLAQPPSSSHPTTSQHSNYNGASSSITAATQLPSSSTTSSRDLSVYQTDSVEIHSSSEVINELLQKPPASKVIEMGFTADEVQTVLQLKLSETGENYKDETELMDAVLAYRLGMNSIGDDQERISNSNLTPSSQEKKPEVGLMMQSKYKPIQKQQAKNKVRSPKKSTKKLSKSEGDICADGDEVDGNLRASVSYPKMPSTFTLKEENTNLKSSRMCKICMENESRVVFLPCGHLVSCAECGQFVMKCNVCSQRVKGSVKVFLA